MTTTKQDKKKVLSPADKISLYLFAKSNGINPEEEKDWISKALAIQSKKLGTTQDEINNDVVGNLAREKNSSSLNQQENKETSCLNNKSIIPTIQECERFIQHLNTHFKLNLPNNLLINIHKTNKNTMGYFTPEQNPEHYTDSKTENKTALNSITLSSYFLNLNPYETLTHELTHFLNNIVKIKDCSSNQYHNKHFKSQAEKLLLKVSKTNKGYAHTEPTEEFNKMLEEYKPNNEVFKILQELQEKGKKGSRLYLFTCANECYKVRCGDKQLKAICGCGEPFIQVE